MPKHKDKYIIVFYILYFSWLFTLTYLTRDPKILNYFSVGVVLFYFAFLNEPNDFLWFFAGTAIPVLLSLINSTDSSIRLNFKNPLETNLWLPLAWGTTLLALRKFYLKIIK